MKKFDDCGERALIEKVGRKEFIAQKPKTRALGAKKNNTYNNSIKIRTIRRKISCLTKQNRNFLLNKTKKGNQQMKRKI